MTTEEFIRDAAKRGWSKLQTMRALGMSTYSFYPLLAALPDIVWAKKGTTLGNRLGNASRPSTPSKALLAALEKAREARRAKYLYTWGGRTGTVSELAVFAKAGERTIQRRLKAGKSVEEAFGAPPNYTPPNAGLRALQGASYQSFTTREGEHHEEESGSQP